MLLRSRAVKRRAFEWGATLYDWLTDHGHWYSHCAKMTRFLPPEGAGGRPLEVLDIGCGPGVSAFALGRALPAARLTGVDISERMLVHAQRHLRRQAPDLAARCAFARGDAYRLPFKDGRFDAITGHSFLYLLDDRDRVLAELRRVLRPGGALVLLEPRRRPGLRFLRNAARRPRFTMSMVLWQLASAQAGRFSDASLRETIEAHGRFRVSHLEPTLDGLGLLLAATAAETG